MKPASRSFTRDVVKFPLELFAATYASTLAAAESMYPLYPLAHAVNTHLSFHQFNRAISLPYFPVQIVVGFLVGYFGRKWFGTRFSFWVWAVPLLLLIWYFFAFNPSAFEGFWQARFDRFLGSACRPPDCWDQIVHTAPVYTAVAYSCGAFVREKRTV